MNTFLFSGVAAVGLMMTGAPAVASSAVSAIGSAPIPSALVTVANGRKAGSGVAMPGQYGVMPGQYNVNFRPRPGFHGIPRTDVYRRPYRGFILPSYWVQPTFYVSNFNRYGLSTPMRGYNWTRYYDDAVLTDSRGYVQDYRSGVNWNNQNDRTSDYQEADYGPAILPDGNAYNWNDDSNVAYAAPDGSSYSYDGNWQGNYVDPQGRVFEGEWEGRVTRQDGVAGPVYPAPRQPMPAPVPQRPAAGEPYGETYSPVTYGYDARRDRQDNYTVPRGYENYERCLKSNGLKGAAIGALLGGVAGNRIAGRGNRTGGSLLGAGIGGLLGVAAEKASNKCRQYNPGEYRPPVYSYAQPQQPYYYYAQPQQAYYYAPQPQQYSAAPMQGGYYYYPQAMPATTVVTGAPYTTTTTTVTEEVYYQNLPSAPRKKVVRKWKPKPRCSCR